MKTIINKHTNPYFNLALEEYLLKEFHSQDDLFFLWRNDPCVVIGRNQNPFNEINMTYAKDHQIPVIRRISGGGSVYHDHGNINFTYITKHISKRLNNYKFFVNPIIDILQRVGLDARFVESSHIYLKDTKISGNAQSFHKNKMVHHGTLLFDSDLEQLKKVLKDKKTFDTHAVDSRRSATTNIKNEIQVDTTIDDFMDFLLSEIFMEDYKKHVLTLSNDDISAVETLAQTKYQSWDWNIGETPEFNITSLFDDKTTEIHIVKGIIRKSSMYSKILEGVRFDQDEILHALSHEKEAHKWVQTLFK